MTNFKLNRRGIDQLTADIAARAEKAFNDAAQAAHGKPLDDAVRIVADRMTKVGVQPNREGIREKLIELGWKD